MDSTGSKAARRRALQALSAWATVAAGLGRGGRAEAAAGDGPLRVGLAPYLSPAALLAAFRPMREHLERALARPIEMVTARDFRSLVEATRQGDYDVVLLPAHVARLAISDWRYEPLAGTLETVSVLVLVRADGPVQTVADLRGGKAGMLDALSLVATVGRQWLQDQGLAADVSVVALPSVNSALISLDRGEVAMVVAARSQLLTLPQGTPRTERVFQTLRDVPGPIYLSRPGVPAAELARIRAALLAYQPDPGRPAAAANAKLHALTAEQLKPLDALAAQARRALAQRP